MSVGMWAPAQISRKAGAVAIHNVLFKWACRRWLFPLPIPRLPTSTAATRLRISPITDFHTWSLGYYRRGEGADSILDTNLSYKVKLPLNTGGALNLVEAVRQLFGEGSVRQVTDAHNGLVTGMA